MSFQRASWRKASIGMSPSSSRLIRSSRLRLKCGCHAFRIVIGSDRRSIGFTRSMPISSCAPVPSKSRKLAQQVRRAARHEIADRRSGKEAELGRACDAVRQARTDGRNRRSRDRPRCREIASQCRRRFRADNRRKYRPAHKRPASIASSRKGVLVAEPAPNSTTAAPRGMREAMSGMTCFEQRRFGARRIVSGQPRDLVEQLRPAQVVEPARRNRRDGRRQARENILAERRIDPVKRLEQGEPP